MVGGTELPHKKFENESLSIILTVYLEPTAISTPAGTPWYGTSFMNLTMDCFAFNEPGVMSMLKGLCIMWVPMPSVIDSV